MAKRDAGKSARSREGAQVLWMRRDAAGQRHILRDSG